MKAGFYPKLAVDGIRKNRKLYLPYILTCSLTVAVFYILCHLGEASTLQYLDSHNTTAFVLMLGRWVLALFSLIFLFYTNSFLIRRRKKEFGLYNILGMNKHSIGKILAWETLLVGILSIGIGLLAGIVLAKLAELGLLNLIGADISLVFTLSWDGILFTLALFTGIFLLIFLNSLRQVRFAKPTDLVKSEQSGEKPPKANWALGIVGVVLLLAAYYIAVTIKNPVDALLWFFGAVLMVIAATYLLFIAGSVTLCRLLQKNKKYYYQKSHFVSVSSMAYRMKRNGAGLASICILLTMIFVMISSTSCMYFSADDSLRSCYPREVDSVARFFDDREEPSAEDIDRLRATVDKAVADRGVTAKNAVEYYCSTVYGLLDGDRVTTDERDVGSFDYSNLADIRLIPLAEYNKKNNTDATLKPEEVLFFATRSCEVKDTLTINGVSLRVKEALAENPAPGLNSSQAYLTVILIYGPDNPAFAQLRQATDSFGGRVLTTQWTYNFDTDTDEDGQLALAQSITEAMSGTDGLYGSFYCEARANESGDYFASFGSFFFLGIVLSAVFLLAAVLIIYYKQLSEGYEDQSRFDIMQKVGMTKEDIRKSINSQMLTVFFAPVVFAALHMAMAFPMIEKLLQLFYFSNTKLMLVVVGATIVVFAVVYAIIYRVTSNEYVAIVSGAKEN